MKRHILSFLASFSVLLASATVDGNWIQHPAADIFSYTGAQNAYANCIKILDGERYTYFEILGLHHDNRYSDYYDIHPQLFRRDKLTGLEEGADIFPLTKDFPVSGTEVMTCNYSPEGKFLAVVYDNDMIDVIHDDGRFFAISAFKDYMAPGNRVANNIVTDLDGVHFYLATGFGFMKFDAQKGEAVEIRNLQSNVNYAGRVGDKMVLFNSITAFAYDLANPSKALKDLEPIEVKQGFDAADYISDENFLKTPDSLMPLGDKEFAFMTQTINGEGIMLVGAWDGNDFKILFLNTMRIGYSNIGHSTYNAPQFINYGVVTPAKDGYFLSPHAYKYLIKKNISPDFTKSDCLNDFISRLMKLKSCKTLSTTSVSSTNEQLVKCASYDNETFWFFYPREGFRCRTYTDGVWSEPGPVHTPAAPVAYRANAFCYHPDYGMMVRNHGDDDYYTSLQYQADGLSSYKDGEWTYRGLPKHNWAERTRLAMPRGIAYDPLNPKYIWGASRYNGLLRLNMEDYSDILTMSRAGDASRNKPGFVAVQPNFKNWSSLCNFGEVKFDKEGTMWVAWTDWDSLYQYGDPHGCIWFWTAEDRLASEGLEKDASKYVPMGEYRVPRPGVQLGVAVWPLEMQRNENIVGWTSGAYFQGAFLYDHNGTLKDTSDDRIATFDNVYDKTTGVQLPLIKPVVLFEDPYDGALLLSSQEGIFVTDREQMFAPVQTGEMLKIEKDIDGINGREIGINGVTDIVSDFFGRKWISTFDEGLYCLSDDRKSLLAHFNTENSPLQSNACLGLGYDPVKGAIWIGTDKGILEFVPQGSLSSTGENPAQIKFSPAVVEPDYFGYLTITGLENGNEYRVVNSATGSAYFKETARFGKIQFNVTLLNAGEYHLQKEADKVEGSTFYINR